MLVGVRLVFGVLVASTLFVGLANLGLGGKVLVEFLDLSPGLLGGEAAQAVDLQLRLLSGAWIALGAIAAAALRNPVEHRLVLRGVLLALALSAVGDLASVVVQGGDAASRIPRVAVQLSLCGFGEGLLRFAVRSAA